MTFSMSDFVSMSLGVLLSFVNDEFVCFCFGVCLFLFPTTCNVSSTMDCAVVSLPTRLRQKASTHELLQVS